MEFSTGPRKCLKTLPCPVHPAGVQRPEPALTEAELAWYESRSVLHRHQLLRLIADLRTARAELADARAEQMAVDASWRRERHELHEDLRASRAEVERLRAEDGAIIARVTGERELLSAEVERLKAEVARLEGEAAFWATR